MKDKINYLILSGHKIRSFQILPGILLGDIKYYPNYREERETFEDREGFIGKIKDKLFGKVKVKIIKESPKLVQSMENGNKKITSCRYFNLEEYKKIPYFKNEKETELIEVKFGKTIVSEKDVLPYIPIFKLPSVSLYFSNEIGLTLEEFYYFRTEEEMISFVNWLNESNLIDVKDLYCVDKRSKSSKLQIENTIKDYFNYFNTIYNG